MAKLDDPASIAYNRRVSSDTVHWAILDWMQDKYLNGIWGVCCSFFHFTMRLFFLSYV